ncbi:MAG: RibD family protein [Prochlorotrichaceae cyanobacterium]
MTVPSSAPLPFARHRPYTTVVLAMTADGKIADRSRQPARFGSPADRAHLEQQIAAVDAVLIGAGTVRAYGSSLRVEDATLLAQRQQQGYSLQPIQILCSASGELDPHWRFFQQPFPRWLITLEDPQQHWWAPERSPVFAQIFQGRCLPQSPCELDWGYMGEQLWQQGIRSLAVLGGGTLVASLFSQGAIDALQLTLCPFLLGGKDAPTPIDGIGVLQTAARSLELSKVETIDHEVFLHYQVLPDLPDLPD